MTINAITKACKGKVIYVELSNGYFCKTKLCFLRDTLSAMYRCESEINCTFDVHDAFIFIKLKPGTGLPNIN